MAPNNKTHGLSLSPVYRVWQTMRLRCGNPTNAAYADYGGRGINVCEGWANNIASNVGCGTYSVADPREKPEGVWLTLDEAKKLLVGPGPWAIVDKSSDGPPVAIIHDLRKPSPFPILIIAEDGTWHRPLTVLELAVLQGLPAMHNGKPLQFTGPATTDREHIGNLVPPPAACAIAEQVLLALAQHELGAFALSGAGGIWVDADAQEGAALQ